MTTLEAERTESRGQNPASGERYPQAGHYQASRARGTFSAHVCRGDGMGKGTWGVRFGHQSILQLNFPHTHSDWGLSMNLGDGYNSMHCMYLKGVESFVLGMFSQLDS